MARLLRPNSRDDFKIAIICALPVECNAVEALLDKVYETDGFSYGKAVGDLNAYTIGRLGNQDVVLAYMPSMGNISAAMVASNLRFSFREIKVGIIVGVCGGVPKTPGGVQIFLGDVIISTSVIQIDFGWQYPNRIIRKEEVEDTLGRANPEIQAFVGRVSGNLVQKRLQDKTGFFSAQICAKDGFSRSAYPGLLNDVLYAANYRHKHQTRNCHICDSCRNQDDEVCNIALESSCEDLGCDTIDSNRSQMTSTEVQGAKPSIHFGRMACSNRVMKSGQHRNRIAAEENVIGFEMESAGTWDSIPTLVIKSVCDYADSHKNKNFQPYAAATAAACTKAVLEEWRSEDRITESQTNIALTQFGSVDQVNHPVETRSFQGNVFCRSVNY
jgi:nucleoside phosphorylase